MKNRLAPARIRQSRNRRTKASGIRWAMTLPPGSGISWTFRQSNDRIHCPCCVHRFHRFQQVPTGHPLYLSGPCTRGFHGKCAKPCCRAIRLPQELPDWDAMSPGWGGGTSRRIASGGSHEAARVGLARMSSADQIRGGDCRLSSEWLGTVLAHSPPQDGAFPHLVARVRY